MGLCPRRGGSFLCISVHPLFLAALAASAMLPSTTVCRAAAASASASAVRRSSSASATAYVAARRGRGKTMRAPPPPHHFRSSYSSTPLGASPSSAFVAGAPFSVPVAAQHRLLSSSSSSLLTSSSPQDGGESNDDSGGGGGGGGGFFADPSVHPTFESIGVSSPVLLDRVRRMLLKSTSSSPPRSSSDASDDDDDDTIRPSAVQAAAYPSISSGSDVTVGAETGSGKTLAYLLPLIDDIMRRKHETTDGYLGYDYARAVVLVPNKELAAQVTRMASELCGGRERCVIWEGGSAPDHHLDGRVGEDDDDVVVDERDIVRLAVMPGGLAAPKDFRPFRMALTDPRNNPPVDILITTPASLGPMGMSPKNIDMFADVRTLVIDEADMLLDGGYIRQLENVLMGFRRADKLDLASHGIDRTQHVFVAATLPDVGLKSVDAYIARKFPRAERVAMDGMHNARHYGLRDRTVWVEDEDGGGNRERMEALVRMLRTPRGAATGEEGTDAAGGGLAGEKVMVFLNSVEDVDGATGALRRAGLDAVPYHAKIPLSERAANLDRFRRFDAEKRRGGDEEDGDDNDDDAVPILVCTDLASRGLDVPGVTAVVQLQFAGNVVAHLHRMGRCGRAGKRDGRGVVFYGGTERELVEVVREAEHQQETMALEQDVMDSEESDEGGDGKKKKAPRGTVKNAFSRKRGFTKKRKKERREARETSASSD